MEPAGWRLGCHPQQKLKLVDLGHTFCRGGAGLLLGDLGGIRRRAELVDVGRQRGLSITEADVISAQLREDSDAPSAELQRRMADESRRLRHFIQG